jgi:hypothetical protein
MNLSQDDTMTVHPKLKQYALAALIGFAMGALFWALAERIYAKAQDDGTIAVDGCARSYGMEPMECV